MLEVSGFRLDLYARYAHGTAGRPWLMIVLAVWYNAGFSIKRNLLMVIHRKMSEESIFPVPNFKISWNSRHYLRIFFNILEFEILLWFFSSAQVHPFQVCENNNLCTHFACSTTHSTFCCTHTKTAADLIRVCQAQVLFSESNSLLSSFLLLVFLSLGLHDNNAMLR